MSFGNLAGFDATTVPEQESFSALPEGAYVAVATASEMKATKNGNGEYLQITWEIIDGAGKGRKLWSRLNLRNANQTAVDIAQRELAAICKAVGIVRPNDSSELHNKPIILNVAVELDDRKRETNTIKKYEAVGNGAGATPVQQSTSTANAAPAASGKKPWEK